MWHSVVFILLTLFLYIQLKTVSRRSFIKAKRDYGQAQQQFDKLSLEHKNLKNDNLILTQTLGDTIALYDITKEICRNLDENNVFSTFRELINSYIRLQDCKFIKHEADLPQYSKYTVLPLSLDQNPIGYLVADGISGQDREKFHILAQQFMLGIKRALLYRKVQELAIKDGLTCVFSRRYLMERFKEEIARSEKFNYKFSLLMVDIDHFKDYNDRYGHFVGDAILKEVSTTVRENIRQIDLVGRYGGEEFVVILTETDREGGQFAAERIRQAIEAKKIRAYDEDLKITISIGIAVFPEDSRQTQALIDNADQALYQAKQSGRNRVCIFTSG